MNKPEGISEKILEKIKFGQIKMRPRLYFVFKLVLLIFGVLLALGLALFLTSFFFFTLRMGGIWFDLRGPWSVLLFVLVLVILLEILLSRFKFAYQRPLIYSLLGLLLLLVLFGWGLDRTDMHSRMMRQTERGRYPWMGRFYRGYRMPMHPGGMPREMRDRMFFPPPAK